MRLLTNTSLPPVPRGKNVPARCRILTFVFPLWCSDVTVLLCRQQGLRFDQNPEVYVIHCKRNGLQDLEFGQTHRRKLKITLVDHQNPSIRQGGELEHLKSKT